MQNKKRKRISTVGDLDRPMTMKECLRLSTLMTQRKYSGLRNFVKREASNPGLIKFMRPGDRVLSVTVKFAGAFKKTQRHSLIIAEYPDMQCELQFGVTDESLRADETSNDWHRDRQVELLKADRVKR
jgi:hypothetical protein